MTPEESKQATEALIRWFKSQEIYPADSIIVMTRAIGIALTSVVKVNPQRANSLAREIAGLIITEHNRKRP
jgi:hypothetical protein